MQEDIIKFVVEIYAQYFVVCASLTARLKSLFFEFKETFCLSDLLTIHYTHGYLVNFIFVGPLQIK